MNTHFLKFFHTTLEQDTQTPQETKTIITNHFITILQKNQLKNNDALLREIVNSRKILEDKLNGNPMSIFLQAAFEIFFVAAIFCVPAIIAGCSAAVVVSLGVGAFIGSAPISFFTAGHAYQQYPQKKQETENLINPVFSTIPNLT